MDELVLLQFYLHYLQLFDQGIDYLHHFAREQL